MFEADFTLFFKNSPEPKGPLLYIILAGICFINNFKIEQMWPSLDHFYRDQEERWFVRVCQSFVVGEQSGDFCDFVQSFFHQPDLYLLVLPFFEPPRKPIEVIHIVSCF